MPERNVPRPRGRALAPAEFAAAVRSLAVARVRDEVRVEEVRPPQKLAPWTHALALTVLVDDEELATGRLVLLHDPAGYEAWEGTLRLVGYASAELDQEMAGARQHLDVASAGQGAHHLAGHRGDQLIAVAVEQQERPLEGRGALAAGRLCGECDDTGHHRPQHADRRSHSCQTD